ncbi:hypothetical protein BKA82DRAFT_156775 [Pisolithus tinctorius]|uniref:Uncharacterized protein n=1 Tax=Pisolithus tinctorius Marx 270 TaxID=870435 RepID=A0A0C3NTX6_PISTI|nr:hypothetical protein BKA82DRAFT_156775 [Pisolithus tinctorius]KIN98870.1 hypothetical protein M404DRAFT_156775 [Pisolithus tinctorius Marx 270]
MQGGIGVHKPRPRTAPYSQKPRTEWKKDAPATSALSVESAKLQNLTLHDWLTVFAYVDEHPDLPQDWVVTHFNSWPEGILKFTQATLS